VLASILMVLSSGIILALGAIHLIYTFSGKKLTPRDPALQTRMGSMPAIATGRSCLVSSMAIWPWLTEKSCSIPLFF
jgi:hypothetical protein